jgi:hypothetical protein
MMQAATSQQSTISATTPPLSLRALFAKQSQRQLAKFPIYKEIASSQTALLAMTAVVRNQ